MIVQLVIVRVAEDRFDMIACSRSEVVERRSFDLPALLEEVNRKARTMAETKNVLGRA